MNPQNPSPNPESSPNLSTEKSTSAQPRRLRTKALIGTHSKCSQMSVYVEQTRWVGQMRLKRGENGETCVELVRWPTVEGVVVIKQPVLPEESVYIQVKCSAVEKSFLVYNRGSWPSIEQELFSQLWRVALQVDGSTMEQHGNTSTIDQHGNNCTIEQRYPFTLDFKHKILPPSGYWDAGLTTETPPSRYQTAPKPVGMTWELHAFVATKQEHFAGGESMNFTTNEKGVVVEKPCLSLKKRLAVGLPIQVVYKYTYASLGSRGASVRAVGALPLPPDSEEMRTSFKTSENVILNASLSSPDPITYSPASITRIDLHVQNLHSLHRIVRIGVEAKQVVEIQLNDMTQHKYKNIVFRFDQHVPPRYEPNTNDGVCHSIEFDFYEKMRMNILNCLRSVSYGSTMNQWDHLKRLLLASHKHPVSEHLASSSGGRPVSFSASKTSSATANHLRRYKLPVIEEHLVGHLRNEDGLSIASTLSPICSTPPLRFQQGASVAVSYYFKIRLYISDPHTVPGMKLERSISAKLPFIVSSMDQRDYEKALADAMGGESPSPPHARSTTPDSPVWRTPDSVGRILSTIMDDLNHCLSTIPCVKEEWIALWKLGSQEGRLCTSAQDHLQVLKSILQQLEQQLLSTFGNIKQSDNEFKWPMRHVPFNHLILESEFLARIGPRTSQEEDGEKVVRTYLSLLMAYLTSARQLVVTWASLRGRVIESKEQDEYEMLVQNFRVDYDHFIQLLDWLK